MERWKTKINDKSEDFKKNYEEMEKLVHQLNERLQMSLSQVYLIFLLFLQILAMILLGMKQERSDLQDC